MLIGSNYPKRILSFFSINKLNFNLRLCKTVVDIIIFIRKIFDRFFNFRFYTILYIFILNILYPIKIVMKNS
jgi:hypothetical protein